MESELNIFYVKFTRFIYKKKLIIRQILVILLQKGVHPESFRLLMIVIILVVCQLQLFLSHL